MRLRPGDRVAIADGAGRPSALSAALSDAAREAGGVSLVTGWSQAADADLDLDAFTDARTVMGGWGWRADIDAGRMRYVPTRIGVVPALLAGPLRPDVLVASVVETPRGLTFGTEVAWMRAAARTGARVVGVLRTGLPACDAGPPLDRVEIVAEDASPPVLTPAPPHNEKYEALGKGVAAWIPEGGSVQIGPGPVGAAVLAALAHPVRLDSGILTDAVVDLEARDLLLGVTMSTYLCGTQALFDWAEGRQFLRGVEDTHHPGRLIDSGPFFAVNTALEIDVAGGVNVESVGGSAVAGVGGHPDYSAAGSACPAGLSIIAVPTTHRGRSTLVGRLSCPPSSAGHDVDVVVTERGAVDLRALDRDERAEALFALWDGNVE